MLYCINTTVLLEISFTVVGIMLKLIVYLFLLKIQSTMNSYAKLASNYD